MSTMMLADMHDVSLALHAHFPETKIWCAEPEFYDDTKRSLETGTIERAQTDKSSICDAIVTPEPGQLTFPVNRNHLSGGAVVSDHQVLKTIATLFKHLKIIVEPGGAVAVLSCIFWQAWQLSLRRSGRKNNSASVYLCRYTYW